MDVVVRDAGLDMHRNNVAATVRVPSDDPRRWVQRTKTLGATLAGLAALREWLAGFGVPLVGTAQRACTGRHLDKRSKRRTEQ